MTNKPEVSPAMTAEERVKAVHKDARVAPLGPFDVVRFGVFTGRWAYRGIIGEGVTKELAWIDAASRLPASPVADQTPICHQCNRPYEWNAAVDAYEHDDPCEVGSMETVKSADKWDALRKAAEKSIPAFGFCDAKEVAAFRNLATPDNILELLNELATLSVTEGVDGWIEIKEGCEMPPFTERIERDGLSYSDDVLAWDGEMAHKAYYSAFDDRSKEWTSTHGDRIAPTHWMPIPAGPSSLDATKGDRG